MLLRQEATVCRLLCRASDLFQPLLHHLHAIWWSHEEPRQLTDSVWPSFDWRFSVVDSIGLPLAWIEAAVKGGYQSQIGACSKIASHLLDGLYGQQGGPDGLGLGCALLQSKPALTCVLIQHGNRFKKLWVRMEQSVHVMHVLARHRVCTQLVHIHQNLLGLQERGG